MTDVPKSAARTPVKRASMLLLAMLVTASAGLGACTAKERQGEQAASAPPAASPAPATAKPAAPASPAPAAPAVTPAPDPAKIAPFSKGPVAFPSHYPGADEDTKLVLRWARSTKIRVQKSPAPNAPTVAEIATVRGKGFEAKSTHTLITKGLPLTARRDMLLDRAGTVIDPATDELIASRLSVSMRKGQSLEFLKYGGEGSCYMRTEGVIYLIHCPERSEFLGAKSEDHHMEPLGQRWWVQIPEGWVEVTPQNIQHEVQGPGWDPKR